MRNAGRLAAAVGSIGGVAWLYVRVLGVSDTTTVALTFLLVVPLVAATSRYWVAIATSVVAVLCFNFFFIPPTGAFTIADPQDWIALFAFLVVGLVASNLSSAGA